jgi:murein DD-endopeptidase MepM/ murein hydrolase activator NlpD
MLRQERSRLRRQRAIRSHCKKAKIFTSGATTDFKNGGTLPPEQPAPGVQQTASPGQTDAEYPSSTQTPNEYGFIWPLPEKGLITSRFGRNDEAHPDELHRGLDIFVPKDTAIFAIADGTVLFSGASKDKARGNVVYIDHGNGVRTVSQHNSRNVVASGDTVRQGQIIAYVGNTGRTVGVSGVHLHLELLMGVPPELHLGDHIPYSDMQYHRNAYNYMAFD